MHFKLRRLFFPINRRCSGCKKKRSLLTNSFFEEFPRVPLDTLFLAIYYFVSEDSQRQTARRLNLNPGLVSKIYRRLQDVCSRDLDERPFTPFGGPGAAVKCDESKFNHKAKVRTLNKCQKLPVTLKKSQAYLCQFLEDSRGNLRWLKPNSTNYVLNTVWLVVPVLIS